MKKESYKFISTVSIFFLLLFWISYKVELFTKHEINMLINSYIAVYFIIRFTFLKIAIKDYLNLFSFYKIKLLLLLNSFFNCLHDILILYIFIFEIDCLITILVKIGLFALLIMSPAYLFKFYMIVYKRRSNKTN